MLHVTVDGPLTTAEGTLPEPRRGGRQNWPFCAAGRRTCSVGECSRRPSMTQVR